MFRAGRWRLRWFALVAGALAWGAPAFAQDTEPAELYEPFEPNAAPLVFSRPADFFVEFENPRTLSKERVAVSPFALVKSYGAEIYVFDIGQADAMLIVGPGPERKTKLVDLGAARDPRYAGRFSSQHVGQRVIDITGKAHLDCFMLSHFHFDHFGSGQSGITDLLAHGEFTVSTMLDTGQLGASYVKRSPSALDYIAKQRGWLEDGTVAERVNPVFGRSQIDLGAGIRVDIQAFAGRTYQGDRGVHSRYQARHPGWYGENPTSENDQSIAFKITVGSFEFWSAGDLSGAAGDGTSELSGSGKGYTNIELPLVKRWLSEGSEHDVEVFRANHHGARYSGTPQLLEALDPEVILYSARGGHGHPSPDAIERGGETALQYTTSLDEDTWTDDEIAASSVEVSGEIRLFVESGGMSYSVNGTKYKSFKDAEERAGVDER